MASRLARTQEGWVRGLRGLSGCKPRLPSPWGDPEPLCVVPILLPACSLQACICVAVGTCTSRSPVTMRRWTDQQCSCQCLRTVLCDLKPFPECGWNSGSPLTWETGASHQSSGQAEASSHHSTRRAQETREPCFSSTPFSPSRWRSFKGNTWVSEANLLPTGNMATGRNGPGAGQEAASWAPRLTSAKFRGSASRA